MTFFNTIRLKGIDLDRAEFAALRQEEKVYYLFKSYPTAELTPFEVQEAVLAEAPITSARRALTCLTEMGLLEKVNRQRPERYGKPNYLWRLATDDGQLALF